MFNLDERYQSYLTGDKKLRIDGVEEKVKGYWYTYNGKDIDGYYLTTENFQLKYNMDGIFLRMEALREVAQEVAWMNPFLI